MAKECVLIIDESPQDIDFVVEHILAPGNYQTLIAQNSKEGLQLLQNQHPALIMADLNEDNLGLLETLKKQNSNIPVIGTLADNSDALALKAFRLGIKTCLPKPVDSPTLLTALDQALIETRLRKERNLLSTQLEQIDLSLTQHKKELKTLFGIGKTVTSSMDQDRLLHRLVEAAVYLTSAEEGTIFLLDNKTKQLYITAARGIDDRMTRLVRLNVNDSLAGQVIMSGQPLLLTDDKLVKIKTGYLVRSLIYVPLKIGGQVIGVLGVSNKQQKHSFTNHHLRLLSALADYTAITLQNGRLTTDAQHENIKLTTILDEIDLPIVVVDEDDRLIMCNAAFYLGFEVDNRAILGQPLTDLVKNQLSLPVNLAELAVNQKSELTLDDGRTFYAAFIPIPYVGRALIMQDITPFKNMEHVKSEFISTLSQSISLPLESIKEYIQMLGLAGELNKKQSLFMDRIGQGTDQIETLMDNLYELAAIESESNADVPLVDLGKLTTQLVAHYQTQANTKNKQLTAHIPAKPALIRINPKRLQQAVSTLIDNALIRTPEIGCISIIVGIDNKQATLKVEDSGPSIPTAELPLLFDKFYRVQNQKEINTGRLDLILCKSIINKCNGHTWAESGRDQDTIFAFTLPLAPIAPPLGSPTVSEIETLV